MEIYHEIHVVFMSANTTSILQSTDQGAISTFKYYLRNVFPKVIAAIDSDSSDVPGQSKLNTFRKEVNILDAIRTWEEVKISVLTGVWKKLIPALMNDFEGFKTSVKEVIAAVVEIARELFNRIRSRA